VAPVLHHDVRQAFLGDIGRRVDGRHVQSPRNFHDIVLEVGWPRHRASVRHVVEVVEGDRHGDAQSVAQFGEGLSHVVYVEQP